MITNKHTTIAQDLRVSLAEVQKHGHTFIAMSGAKAYVFAQGQAYEIAPGMTLNLPSISQTDLANISGCSVLGTPEDSLTVFSRSSTKIEERADFTAKVIDPKTIHVVDGSDVMEAAREFASSWSNVIESQDRALSASAARQVEWTFVGKEIVIEDASDEFDLTLNRNDKFTLQYINRDNYVLKIKCVREKFYLTGNKRVLNLLANCETKNPLGAVGNNTTDTFKYVGTVNRKMIRPVRLAKGTRIYQSGANHYLEYNLALPMKDIMSKTDIATVLKACVFEDSVPDYSGGKLIKDAFTPPAGMEVGKIETEKKKEIWGVAVPVNANQMHRSRLYFSEDADHAKQMALSQISNSRVPVPFLLFSTNNMDSLYKESLSGRVLIKNTELVRRQYRATEMRIQAPIQEFINLDPREDTPDLTIPAIDSDTAKVVDQIRALVDLGYFINGIRLDINQPRNAIQFAAQYFDDMRYNALVGAARRIIVWLRRQGVPVDSRTVSLVRGEKLVQLEFKFQKPRDPSSVEKLQSNPPTLDAPIYTNTKRSEPTVEIVSVNIHTGQVVCRMQRSATLYSAPYTESYKFIERKSF